MFEFEGIALAWSFGNLQGGPIREEDTISKIPCSACFFPSNLLDSCLWNSYPAKLRTGLSMPGFVPLKHDKLCFLCVSLQWPLECRSAVSTLHRSTQGVPWCWIKLLHGCIGANCAQPVRVQVCSGQWSGFSPHPKTSASVQPCMYIYK